MGAPAEATNTVPKPADRRVPYTVRRVTGALEAMPSWKRISRLIRVAARMIQDALAYKERVIANAEGDADRFLKVLKEYKRAPEVTRKRLYMDALESVLSNSSKLMIDIKDGNNLMLLPLDKIINAEKLDESVTEDEEDEEYTEDKTNVRESR